MARTASPVRIALLGAESTGKTQLTQALAAALDERGHSVTVVPEVLRGWCERQGRTPHAHEQVAIAHEQARQALAADTDVVIADTTPLMTAVYSHLLFQDESLYDFALAHQSQYDLTLLTGLDLPWVADGLQRDGPQVREPVDALLRAALARTNVTWQVIYGSGQARLEAALRALAAHTEYAQRADNHTATPWAWSCDSCSDAECEHRLFTRLLSAPTDR